MLDPAFQFIEKLITDFTWRRLFMLIGIVLLFVSLFVLYEWQTATSELTRYERTVALLQALDGLEKSSSPGILELSKSIVENLNQVVQSKNIGSFLEFSPSRKTSQVFFAVAPWLLFGFIVITLAMMGKQDDLKNILLGLGTVAFVTGMLSYLIPQNFSGLFRFGVPLALNLLILMYFINEGNKKQ